MVVAYLMGGDNVSRYKQKGKEWSNWGRSANSLVASLIVTMLPEILVLASQETTPRLAAPISQSPPDPDISNHA